MKLKVNGQVHDVDVEPTTPLLWVLREQLGLMGTKFGCGVSMCGVCTVHVDGSPVRSCVKRAVTVGSQEVTTIEGLAKGGALHPVQQAWLDEQVPQCGYCQSGQIMLACGLLKDSPNPTDEVISEYMSDNFCRCGSYPQILAAVRRAAQSGGGGGHTP